MKRISIPRRDDWQALVSKQGLTFHTIDGATYWHEEAAYVFTADEVDRIEDATNELHRCCLAAVEQVVRHRRFPEFAIAEKWWSAIEHSWANEREMHLYGRFDLTLDERGTPRMLEYNADTPTALLEASVIQWFWLEDLRQRIPAAQFADQFNLIHECLQERFRQLGGPAWCFAAHLDSAEDRGTVGYLAEVAASVGLTGSVLDVADIGWNGACFTNLDEQRLTNLFKLYPWEWLLDDPFAAHLTAGGMRVIEPLWKILLSTKAILPVLWEMFPDHPNLLRAAHAPWSDTFARKPLRSREGANVDLRRHGKLIAANGGGYGAEGFIYQDLCPLQQFAGNHAVIGSWVVGDRACGMGIREDDGPVTTDGSRFVPHLLLDH